MIQQRSLTANATAKKYFPVSDTQFDTVPVLLIPKNLQFLSFPVTQGKLSFRVNFGQYNSLKNYMYLFIDI